MKKVVSIFAALVFCALLLMDTEQATSAVQEGFSLCIHSVLPSLFPFLAAIGFLLKLGAAEALGKIFSPLMKPLFHMRGVCAAPLLTGFLGGHPAGAATAAQLYGRGVLTREEAELLLGFCNNCGPAFILGYVGISVLGDPMDGVRLLVIHILSACLTGWILSRLSKERGALTLPTRCIRIAVSPGRAFTAAVLDAGAACLRISAFVILFRVLVTLLPVPPLLGGIFEMVTGLSRLHPGDLTAAAVLIGWGGLSVHAQTMAVTDDLSLKWHWIGKGIQAVLSGLLSLLLI